MQSNINIYDGVRNTETVIDRSEVQVIGQTLGEWVFIRKIHFAQRQKSLCGNI